MPGAPPPPRPSPAPARPTGPTAGHGRPGPRCRRSRSPARSPCTRPSSWQIRAYPHPPHGRPATPLMPRAAAMGPSSPAAARAARRPRAVSLPPRVERGEIRVVLRQVLVAVAVRGPVRALRLALLGLVPLEDQGDQHHDGRDLAERPGDTAR